MYGAGFVGAGYFGVGYFGTGAVAGADTLIFARLGEQRYSGALVSPRHDTSAVVDHQVDTRPKIKFIR